MLSYIICSRKVIELSPTGSLLRAHCSYWVILKSARKRLDTDLRLYIPVTVIRFTYLKLTTTY